MRTTRITITRIVATREHQGINAELQYLAGSLGLFNPRDKDRSKFRIFIALLRALKQRQRGLSSDELAAELDLTRATVIHHLGSLAASGIVEHSEGKYVLRVETLEELVAKIRSDVGKMLSELEEVARRCDTSLGLR